MLCCARYGLISVVRYDSCLLRLVSPYLRILLPLLTPLGLGQGVWTCAHVPFCALVFTRFSYSILLSQRMSTPLFTPLLSRGRRGCDRLNS